MGRELPLDNKSKKLDAAQIALLLQAEKVMELAAHVSDPVSDAPQGWKVFMSSSPDEAKTSGFFARIYERTGPLQAGESKYMVAFRGTDKLSDKKDLSADIEIGLRFLPHQYWKALAFVQNACKENGLKASELEFTGDSLGGYLARTVGSTLNVKKIWAFNSPGPTKKIKDCVENLIPGVSSPPGNRLIQVRSSSDLVSRWGYDEGIIFAIKTVGSPHSLVGLRQGIDAAISGQSLPPEKKQRLSLSLSSIYNSLSKRMTQSRFVNKLIDRLVGQTKGTAPPRNVYGIASLKRSAYMPYPKI